MSDQSALRDSFSTALDMAREMTRDRVGIVGYGVIEHRGPDGTLLLSRPFANMITTVGDQYYAQQAIAGIPPVNSTGAATKITGMQIGSSIASGPSKSGAGAALGGYLFGKAFDAGYPTATAVGGDTGWQATYLTTFAAAQGTGTVVEAVITNTGTITTLSASANTIARIGTGTIAKAAGDSLAITWRHVFLGA